MNKLISTETLKEWVENWLCKAKYYHPDEDYKDIPVAELYDILEQMPSAEETIRCKDCVCHADFWKDNDYCSMAKKREEND